MTGDDTWWQMMTIMTWDDKWWQEMTSNDKLWQMITRDDKGCKWWQGITSDYNDDKWCQGMTSDDKRWQVVKRDDKCCQVMTSAVKWWQEMTRSVTRLQASAAKWMWTALLRVITRRVAVIPYWRFGKTNRSYTSNLSHLQGSTLFCTVEHRIDMLPTCPLKVGPTGCPEPSVRNYDYSSRNDPQ